MSAINRKVAVEIAEALRTIDARVTIVNATDKREPARSRTKRALAYLVRLIDPGAGR